MPGENHGQLGADSWKRRSKQEEYLMLKNTMRGVLGLILTAAATWLANYIVEQMFGSDEKTA